MYKFNVGLFSNSPLAWSIIFKFGTAGFKKAQIGLGFFDKLTWSFVISNRLFSGGGWEDGFPKNQSKIRLTNSVTPISLI